MKGLGNLLKVRIPGVKEGSVTDAGYVMSLILGWALMILTFGIGQRVAKSVDKAVPQYDASPKKIINEPTTIKSDGKVYIG